MPYFAHVQLHEGHLFRLDTRIYLRDQDEPGDCDVCIAAIIGSNPGSAMPTQLDCLTRLSLDGDNLLPSVRKRFRDAYKQANTPIPPGAFIRVWNRFYLCNKKRKDAIAAYKQIKSPLFCSSESDVPRIVWFAWGRRNPSLDKAEAAKNAVHRTSRFLEREIAFPFYYDTSTEKVVRRKPNLTSPVKHTQGMPAPAIVSYLKGLIANQRNM